ncbi:hypothetical protein B9Y88_20800 [Stenotrophomonas maltophilia]|uniref:DUF3658 domain-containing protein n=1 Tax=Stenotrophomonas TaxID=40323 RepID=UPI000C25FEE2|nr:MULTISPECIES: DUF3658 domain-containing protein [unclassified Stenotrophomonas]MCU1057738.1 hypothetical protein [Stenotrophomonas maltophilia]MDH1245912.1 DUF3658 domain-containing protein [Stenotrophomonas sp. GD03948]MDH1580614.1 DUF3658 domain-containing protein [Stenotrophomonas sp. GD03744]PJL75233.1 hypothetical protein B9Y88_20800 [Stenotrophomonas maltophilia]PZT37132.1 hypothetical protein A7X94_09350 [Stenotrophomonas maltophilia]
MNSYQSYPIRRDAVLCSLAELPDGGLRVVLDDLRQSDTPGQWKNHVFVTFKDYPAGQFDPATLPKEELEAFGHYVLVRLLAINGCLRDTDERSDNDAHRTDQARQNIAALTSEDIASIDEQLFSLCDGQFRKIAYIVGMVMSLQPKCRSGIPDVFYARRVRMLVERGMLQAQGDLTRMGCCEVRVRQ